MNRFRLKWAIPVLLLVAATASGDTSRTTPAASFRVRVEVMDKVALSAKRDGFVQSINLRPGVVVAKGDTVVTLDSEQESLHLQQLQHEMEGCQERAENETKIRKAESSQHLAKLRVSELRRAEKMTRIPKLEIEEAESDLSLANAELQDAASSKKQAWATCHSKSAEVKLAQLNVQYSNIVAPFDGVVYQQFKHPGEAIRRGEKIAELYRLDYLTANVLLRDSDIPLHDAAQLKGEIEIDVAYRTEPLRFPIASMRIVPRIERDGRFMAVVRIKNRMIRHANGKTTWALLPGATGRLTVRAIENGMTKMVSVDSKTAE